ncbi:hypothetical protein ACOQFV_04930 [Nocardiopsis changdeensis]|uniref:Uncharacterized protein n=1 Tax=Nocardiopsis changdeensis TaxID=2831969 RepID=A0ABX8BMB2_9ACTN|nr:MULTISPECIES: hypothetical protein [Nocardiopsis]QUX23231.1 hypothetical protein KGD84_02185 [Nocardiopsis changdeensis]QYX39173.1 hypothetical protein K1J57_11635 [Nocardiopsis sp. MT53]
MAQGKSSGGNAGGGAGDLGDNPTTAFEPRTGKKLSIAEAVEQRAKGHEASTRFGLDPAARAVARRSDGGAKKGRGAS